MSTKPTGLSAFTRKSEQPAEVASGRKKRAPRGHSEVVALTVRLPRAEWMRLLHLAASQSISLQAMAIQGFNKVLAEQGLPSISSDVETS